MTFFSYAQNYEDVMLWRALKHVDKGFYVDVGAYSSYEHSVTRAFYDRGWHGINVEPNPKYLAELNENRIHDVNLGVAISNTPGTVKLHVVEDTGLTTLLPDVAKMHEKAGWSNEPIEVQAQTLSGLWEEHIGPSQQVHFLKIDVEGNEKAALQGLDFKKYRPWIVVVEATVPLSQEVAHADWEDILLNADYLMTYWDGLNRFYVAKEHGELQQAFSAPPNVFDDYVLIRYSDPLAQLQSDLNEASRARQAAEEARQSAEVTLRNHTENLKMVENKLTELAAIVTAMRDKNARTLFHRILFRSSGRPRKPLMKLLFHNSGKPRGMFKKWVVRPDGRPRGEFRKWMESDQYQAKPQAVIWAPKSSAITKELSPRAEYFLDQLKAAQTSKRGI